ncbi:MAG: HD domain-containing protein [Schleiferiaceae bacterium]
MQEKLKALETLISERFAGESSGHDTFHIARVVKNARWIAEREGVDSLWPEVLAWVHELGDYKVEEGLDPAQEIKKALTQCGFSEGDIETVVSWAADIGFRGGLAPKQDIPIEVAIVSDADLIDALGAMGVARTFAYGGTKGREMYNPNIPPVAFSDAEEYKKNQGPTHNHFYEKLLRLPQYLRTKSGQELGAQRHKITKDFLEQFEAEM